MTYIETLKKAKEHNIDNLTLAIATECECIFDFNYTYNEFNSICEFIRYCYLKAERVEIWQLVKAVADEIENGLTIDGVLDLSYWDIIEKAVDY